MVLILHILLDLWLQTDKNWLDHWKTKGHNSLHIWCNSVKLAGPHPLMTCNIPVEFGIYTLYTFRLMDASRQKIDWTHWKQRAITHCIFDVIFSENCRASSSHNMQHICKVFFFYKIRCMHGRTDIQTVGMTDNTKSISYPETFSSQRMIKKLSNTN